MNPDQLTLSDNSTQSFVSATAAQNQSSHSNRNTLQVIDLTTELGSEIVHIAQCTPATSAFAGAATQLPLDAIPQPKRAVSVLHDAVVASAMTVGVDKVTPCFGKDPFEVPGSSHRLQLKLSTDGDNNTLHNDSVAVRVTDTARHSQPPTHAEGPDVTPKPLGYNADAYNPPVQPVTPPLVELEATHTPGTIFERAEQLMLMFPDADPSMLYHRLEIAPDLEVEVTRLANELRRPSATDSALNAANFELRQQSLPRSLVQPTHHQVTNHQEILMKIADIQEITGGAGDHAAMYAQLIRAPNLDVEVARIVADLLCSQHVYGDDELHLGTTVADKAKNVDAPRNAEILAVAERAAIDHICQMFPDIDPQYVVTQICQRGLSAEALVDVLTRDSSYPKLKTRLETLRREEHRRLFLDDTKFDVDEFLLIFEQPETYFMDISRMVTPSYVHHALVQLQNDFPQFTEQYLQNVLEAHKNHYLPARRALQQEILESAGRGGGKRRKDARYLMEPRRQEVPWPDHVEEQFFRELQYARYEIPINDTLETRRRERQANLDQARREGQLTECTCCMSDECLLDDLIICEKDRLHTFCRECVKRHAQELICQGRHMVTCIQTGCDAHIHLATLRQLLSPQLISLYLRRQTEDELRRVSMANLIGCPFCDFMAIVENEEDRVFRCQNPDCLRESCRLCKESNHVPLKCDEVERAGETAMRTFVENKMAEAMIRVCPRCGKRIIKDSGCNKLSCVCGQAMCYICRQPLTSGMEYEHFRVDLNRAGTAATASAGCQLHTSMYEVHQAVAEKAGAEAKAKYLQDHPDAAVAEDKMIDVTALVDQQEDTSDLGVDDHHRELAEFLRRRRDNIRQQHFEAQIAPRGAKNNTQNFVELPHRRPPMRHLVGMVEPAVDRGRELQLARLNEQLARARVQAADAHAQMQRGRLELEMMRGRIAAARAVEAIFGPPRPPLHPALFGAPCKQRDDQSTHKGRDTNKTGAKPVEVPRVAAVERSHELVGRDLRRPEQLRTRQAMVTGAAAGVAEVITGHQALGRVTDEERDRQVNERRAIRLERNVLEERLAQLRSQCQETEDRLQVLRDRERMLNATDVMIVENTIHDGDPIDLKWKG